MYLFKNKESKVINCGKAIENALIEQNKSKTSLAESLCVKKSQITRWTKNTDAKVLTMDRIAKELDMDIYKLLMYGIDD
jgi:plasmid maintenance system antidote protein VapI